MRSLIAFFEIPAIDLNRAVKFYEAVFNIKLPVVDCGEEMMAFFPEEEGVCPGAVSFAKDFQPSSDGVLISLSVENMSDALIRVEKASGKILRQKTKIEAEGRGYFSIFIDSEGNRVGLYSDN